MYVYYSREYVHIIHYAASSHYAYQVPGVMIHAVIYINTVLVGITIITITIDTACSVPWFSEGNYLCSVYFLLEKYLKLEVYPDTTVKLL